MTVFEPLRGRLGAFCVGQRPGSSKEWLESQLLESHGVRKLNLVNGALLYLRPDGRIDAIEVGPPFSGTFLGGRRIGDPVDALFVGDEPTFPARFVELSGGALYFRAGPFGLSFHTRARAVQDGPFSENDWQAVLADSIARLSVSHHDEKLLAY